MEETQRRFRRAAPRSGNIGGQTAGTKSLANCGRNYHVRLPRVADLDGDFVGDKGAVAGASDEVGGGGVESSGARAPADGGDGGEESGQHGGCTGSA